MGYDIHITRRDFWGDNGEPAITRKEWQAILARDSDLGCVGDEDTAQMLDPTGRAARFFWHIDGEIAAIKSDRPVLMSLVAVQKRQNKVRTATPASPPAL